MNKIYLKNNNNKKTFRLKNYFCHSFDFAFRLRLLDPTEHLCVHVFVYTSCIYYIIHLHVTKLRTHKKNLLRQQKLSAPNGPQHLAMHQHLKAFLPQM